jgi:tetratricopeptide (TPR) repeat protein
MQSILIGLVLVLGAVPGSDENRSEPSQDARQLIQVPCLPAGLINGTRQTVSKASKGPPGIIRTAAVSFDPDKETTALPPPRRLDSESGIEKLAADLKALIAEREKASESAQGAENLDAAEIGKLRLRLAELLVQMSMQKREARAAADAAKRLSKRAPTTSLSPKTPLLDADAKSVRKKAPPAIKSAPVDRESENENQTSRHSAGTPAAKTGSSGDTPVDPLSLAQALYRTGDYEGALATYRLINQASLDRMNRGAVQYLMATCLRNLGKTDEAAALYREVVNSKEDPFVSDCAQWQLGALRWRRELESRLQQLRQRRQAVEVKP